MEHISTVENPTVLNRLGAITSTVCALHCALCALAPALLSILGLSVLISHEAEWIFTILASIIAGLLLYGDNILIKDLFSILIPIRLILFVIVGANLASMDYHYIV